MRRELSPTCEEARKLVPFIARTLLARESWHIREETFRVLKASQAVLVKLASSNIVPVPLSSCSGWS